VKNKLLLALAGLAMITAPMAAPALAQATSRLTFAKGNDNTSVKGTIKGSAYRDYKLRVGNGQKLSVSISKGQPYFNIMPPGSDGDAVFIGSSEGNDAVNIPTVAGDYTIRVYVLGGAKTSGKSYPYTLSVAVVNF
jgi:hypothetical protein